MKLLTTLLLLAMSSVTAQDYFKPLEEKDVASYARQTVLKSKVCVDFGCNIVKIERRAFSLDVNSPDSIVINIYLRSNKGVKFDFEYGSLSGQKFTLRSATAGITESQNYSKSYIDSFSNSILSIFTGEVAPLISVYDCWKLNEADKGFGHTRELLFRSERKKTSTDIRCTVDTIDYKNTFKYDKLIFRKTRKIVIFEKSDFTTEVDRSDSSLPSLNNIYGVFDSSPDNLKKFYKLSVVRTCIAKTNDEYSDDLKPLPDRYYPVAILKGEDTSKSGVLASSVFVLLPKFYRINNGKRVYFKQHRFTPVAGSEISGVYFVSRPPNLESPFLPVIGDESNFRGLKRDKVYVDVYVDVYGGGNLTSLPQFKPIFLKSIEINPVLCPKEVTDSVFSG